MELIDLNNNDVFQQHLQDNGETFKKTGKTHLRKATEEEVGKSLKTYRVNDDGVVEENTLKAVNPGALIARNPGPPIGTIDGEPIYNQWSIEEEKAKELYGHDIHEELTTDFSEEGYEKIPTIQAVQVTRELLDKMGIEGDSFRIDPPFDTGGEGQLVELGDSLNDSGYCISKHDMNATYEQVSPKPKQENIEEIDCEGARKTLSENNKEPEKPKSTSKYFEEIDCEGARKTLSENNKEPEKPKSTSKYSKKPSQ